MLVALFFVVILGFTALAVDVGRFYMERRFLQNAADAAALGCAYTFASSPSTPQTAWDKANEILQSYGLRGNPLGLTVSYPARGAEIYDGAVTGQDLISGILPQTSPALGCRVALTVDVPTFFVRIVNAGLDDIELTVRAYARTKGGFVPSVAQRFANPPGPGNGTDTQFIDHVMAEGFDYQCSTTNPAGCTGASLGSKGREFTLFGQSAKASNDSSFRGYIGLDVRDFTTTDGATPPNLVHLAYNAVPPNANVQTLKDFEANWILEGYPGPDLCVVLTTNFLPCAQVSALNGSSSGIFVEEYEKRYRIGDKILLQLYDGTIKTVPDFSPSAPTLVLPAIGSAATHAVPYTMSKQFELSPAQVTTTLIPDNGTLTSDGGGDPTLNPFLSGAATTGTFSANPTPAGASSYGQSWSGITVTGGQKGIYQAWLRGTSSAPYAGRTHDVLVNINVDGQLRDYSLTASDAYASVGAPGTPATFNVRITTATAGSTKWTANGAITLSWAKCPTSVNPLISPPVVLDCYIGSPGTMSVPGLNAGSTTVFTTTTGAAATGEVYRGWVRAAGLDENNKRVSHLLEVTLEVNVVSGGVSQYVDVLGYAVFEVTAVDSNEVRGRALTGAIADPNDPALAIGRRFSLVPWEMP